MVKMIHRPYRRNRKRGIVFFRCSQRTGEVLQLCTDVADGLLHPVLADMYPGQAEMRFVREGSRVKRAVAELLLKLVVRKLFVYFHDLISGCKDSFL